VTPVLVSDALQGRAWLRLARHLRGANSPGVLYDTNIYKHDHLFSNKLYPNNSSLKTRVYIITRTIFYVRDFNSVYCTRTGFMFLVHTRIGWKAAARSFMFLVRFFLTAPLLHQFF
jgi:hypothetical protein